MIRDRSDAQLWLAGPASGARPTAVLGSYARLLYQHTDRTGTAVVRNPVLASPPLHADRTVALEQATENVPHQLGILAALLSDPLEQAGIALPDGLRTSPDKGPASSIGFGATTLMVVAGQIHTANVWQFGRYRLHICVHDDDWVGMLARRATAPALAWTADYLT